MEEIYLLSNSRFITLKTNFHPIPSDRINKKAHKFH